MLKPYSPDTSGWTATIVNSVIFQRIRELPVGQFLTLNEDDAIAPEILSYQAFNSYDYAWVIMVYNNFIDIRELAYINGTRTIKIPERSALMNLITELTS